MERSAYLAALRRDAEALLAAAPGHLDAAVPSCPGWRVERLVGHVGRVYRWTARWVTTGASQDVERPPAGEAVVAWAGEGLAEVVAALEAGDDDRPVATWVGEQPARFWPRRMAVETALHRWDLQAAVGEPEPLDGELAVDGIDEVFDVLLPERAPEALVGEGETLHLHATDVAGEWLVTLGAGPPRVERTHAKGDVAVRASASDLLLLLWNRADPERLEVFGDTALLRRWADNVRL